MIKYNDVNQDNMIEFLEHEHGVHFGKFQHSIEIVRQTYRMSKLNSHSNMVGYWMAKRMKKTHDLIQHFGDDIPKLASLNGEEDAAESIREKIDEFTNANLRLALDYLDSQLNDYGTGANDR